MKGLAILLSLCLFLSVVLMQAQTPPPAGEWLLQCGSIARVLWRDQATGKTIAEFPGSYNGLGLLGGATHWGTATRGHASGER